MATTSSDAVELPEAIGDDESRWRYGTTALGVETMLRLFVVTGLRRRGGRSDGKPGVDARPWVAAVPEPFRQDARAAAVEAAHALTGMAFTRKNVERYIVEAHRRLLARLAQRALGPRSL